MFLHHKILPMWGALFSLLTMHNNNIVIARYGISKLIMLTPRMCLVFTMLNNCHLLFQVLPTLIVLLFGFFFVAFVVSCLRFKEAHKLTVLLGPDLDDSEIDAQKVGSFFVFLYAQLGMLYV